MISSFLYWLASTCIWHRWYDMLGIRVCTCCYVKEYLVYSYDPWVGVFERWIRIHD